MGKNQSYNERAYRLRNSKGGRPWNLEVVTAHPAEVDKTAERGLFAKQDIRPDVLSLKIA